MSQSPRRSARRTFHVERINSHRRLRPVSLLALVLVPLLVVGVLLGTAWGSQKRLDKVTAAVVNSDKAVTVKGQTVPLGRQLSAEIVSHQAENITWVLSDPSDGAAGLASGKYAAVVTIPENFSQAATSMASADTATQATIDVATSPAAPVADAMIARQVADLAMQSTNKMLTGNYLGNIYVGFNTMGQQLTTMANGAKQLGNGATQLQQGVAKAAAGTAQLGSGMQELDDNGSKLAAGGTQLQAGATKLSSGIGTYTSGVSQVVDGIGALDGGIQKLDAGLAQAGSSSQFAQLTGLKTGAAQVAAGASGLSTGLGAYQAQLNAWASGKQAMPTQVAQAWQTQSLAQCKQQVAQGLAQANSPQTKKAVTTAVDAQLKQLQPQIAQIAQQAGLDEQQTAQLVAQVQKGISDGIQSTDIDQTTLKAVGAQVDTTVCPKVGQALQPVFAGGFQAGAATASAALDHKDAKTGQSLKSGAAALASGAGQLSAGVTQLVDQLPKTIAAQMAKLKSGVDQLASGSHTLATKSQALKSGGTQLASGATQLSSGIGTYASGVSQYTAGVHQANTGAQQLASGMTQLDSGAGKLATGLDTFATKVGQGAKQVPSYDATQRERLSDVVSAPVTGGADTISSPLKQLTSLLLVLGLWLGALATWLVVRPVASRTLTSSRPSWQIAGATMVPGALVSAAQAVVLGVLGSWALHLGIGRGLGLAAYLVLVGLAFTAVNHALAAWLGGIGRGIALVLGVIAAAVGIVSAVPGWFSSIHAFSPISPALTGVRDIVAHHSLGLGPVGGLVLLGLLGAGLSLLSVVRRRQVSPAGLRRAAPGSLR